MTALILIVLGLIACACAVVAMMGGAPEGYEDETGFHLGVPYEGDKA